MAAAASAPAKKSSPSCDNIDEAPPLYPPRVEKALRDAGEWEKRPKPLEVGAGMDLPGWTMMMGVAELHNCLRPNVMPEKTSVMDQPAYVEHNDEEKSVSLTRRGRLLYLIGTNVEQFKLVISYLSSTPCLNTGWVKKYGYVTLWSRENEVGRVGDYHTLRSNSALADVKNAINAFEKIMWQHWGRVRNLPSQDYYLSSSKNPAPKRKKINPMLKPLWKLGVADTYRDSLLNDRGWMCHLDNPDKITWEMGFQFHLIRKRFWIISMRENDFHAAAKKARELRGEKVDENENDDDASEGKGKGKGMPGAGAGAGAGAGCDDKPKGKEKGEGKKKGGNAKVNPYGYIWRGGKGGKGALFLRDMLTSDVWFIRAIKPGQVRRRYKVHAKWVEKMRKENERPCCKNNKIRLVSDTEAEFDVGLFQAWRSSTPSYHATWDGLTVINHFFQGSGESIFDEIPDERTRREIASSLRHLGKKLSVAHDSKHGLDHSGYEVDNPKNKKNMVAWRGACQEEYAKPGVQHIVTKWPTLEDKDEL